MTQSIALLHFKSNVSCPVIVTLSTLMHAWHTTVQVDILAVPLPPSLLSHYAPNCSPIVSDECSSCASPSPACDVPRKPWPRLQAVVAFADKIRAAFSLGIKPRIRVSLDPSPEP
jgi:hypothetical protein